MSHVTISGAQQFGISLLEVFLMNIVSPRPSMIAMVCATMVVFPACGDGGTDNPCTNCGGQGGSGDGGSAGGSGGQGGAGSGGDGGLGTGGAPLPPPFTPGHVFVAGSRNARVFELDEQLQTVTSWTHPSFGTELPAPGQAFGAGPAGMAFDKKGHLVVAGVAQLCVFSAPGVELACHPKVKEQPTENLIFDKLGNIYSTTATGGTDEIHKYDVNYVYQKTFMIPTGSLTGITCDPDSNLYVASQTGGGSNVYKVDKDSLGVLDTITVTGMVEGLQFVGTDAIWMGAGNSLGVRKIKASSPYAELSNITNPGLYWAVPVTVDNAGNVYTADYENGQGTAPADLYKFDSNGNVLAARTPSEVYGPFGMVVAGTSLSCGAYEIPK